MKNPEMLEALSALAIEKGISDEIMLEALAERARHRVQAACPTRPRKRSSRSTSRPARSSVIAQELDEDGNVTREWDDTPDDFGRIAAQTAKQVILPAHPRGRARDEVRGVRRPRGRHRHRHHPADRRPLHAARPRPGRGAAAAGRAGARTSATSHGAALKAYIVEVRKTAKGPQIVVSAAPIPGSIKRLFELEVPEIADGVVEIKAVRPRARAPHEDRGRGRNDHNVDPVGACVGARGARVRMVVNELRGEKIDIVPFSDDPPDFVDEGARRRRRCKEVRIHEDTGTAEVIVPDFQLSLAIGKEGQNARLAARLTGWRVDIKSETQLAEEEAYGGEDYAEGEWVERRRRRARVAAGRGRRGDLAAEAGYGGATAATTSPPPAAAAAGSRGAEARHAADEAAMPPT